MEYIDFFEVKRFNSSITITKEDIGGRIKDALKSEGITQRAISKSKQNRNRYGICCQAMFALLYVMKIVFRSLEVNQMYLAPFGYIDKSLDRL